jgi:hypothetical protein
MSAILAPNGTLAVSGTAGNDIIELSRSGSTITLKDNGRTQQFSAASVKRLAVTLKEGNDKFTASSSITQSGKFGGGDGNDTITAGGGNDILLGARGNDQLNGGGGNDRLFGDLGNDILHGNAGDDTLYGYRGNDNLFGDDGADLLVDIGGGNRDTLNGGNGIDNFWCDANASEKLIDAQLLGVEPFGVHRIAAFFDGLSRELDGQSFNDPAAPTNEASWKNFSYAPLFGPKGPTESDVRQGHADSSFLLAPLAAVAKKSRAIIRDHIVGLGDGTYAVKIDSPQTNSAVYVRVDADLPVSSSDASKLYGAALGAGGSTWVALYEKAMCVVRCASLGMSASYSAAVGNASATLGFEMLGLQSKPIARGSSTAEWQGNIKKWLDLGQPAFISLMTTVGSPPAKYQVFGIQSVKTTPVWVEGGGPLGLGHFVQVPVSITLRNPLGIDGIGNDANPKDGLVTLSVSQFDQAFFTVAVGGSIGIE